MLMTFIFWSFLTILVLLATHDIFALMRGPGFAILCVGYIIILSVYWVGKKILRKFEDEY